MTERRKRGASGYKGAAALVEFRRLDAVESECAAEREFWPESSGSRFKALIIAGFLGRRS